MRLHRAAMVNAVSRIVLAAVLLGLICFCAFGFAAAFEISDPLERLPWHLGYSSIALASCAGLLRVWKRRRMLESLSRAESSRVSR